MLVYKLVQQNCPNSIKYFIGTKLGDGADGEVFDLIDYPNLVIKFTILYGLPEASLLEKYSSIDSTLKFLSHTPVCTCARVYQHEMLGIYTRPWDGATQQYLLYYSVLEKLCKISTDEYRVFHSLISHEDQEKKKDLSPAKVKKMLAGMATALDFDSERVTFFYENFDKSPIKHLDVHPRNIMKDSIGNFKLVDFDRTLLIGD